MPSNRPPGAKTRGSTALCAVKVRRASRALAPSTQVVECRVFPSFAAQYGAIAQWLRELQALHIVSDVFLHLDLAKFAPKTDATRRWATEQQQARGGRRTNLSRLAGVRYDSACLHPWWWRRGSILDFGAA